MSMMIRRGIARAAKAVPVISYDVPEPKVEVKAEPKMEPKEEPKVEPKVAQTVNRKDVESMPYFSLKSLASKNGIDVSGKKTAGLRAEIIEVLGL